MLRRFSRAMPRQEQVPAEVPATFLVEAGGALVGQLTAVEQLAQRLGVPAGTPVMLAQLVVVAVHRTLALA
jgi:hypothetical protein